GGGGGGAGGGGGRGGGGGGGRGGRGGRGEFAPHEARTTSSTGRVSTVPLSVRGSSIAAASLSSARRPIAATSARTVVSGGWTKRATGTSSKPASAMSSGTRTPASVSANRQPIAMASLAANT